MNPYQWLHQWIPLCLHFRKYTLEGGGEDRENQKDT